jgi:hypothetical protein
MLKEKISLRKNWMIIGIGLLVAAVLGALIISYFRFAVSESRLEVGKDGAYFPAVSGFNLNRQEYEFPRDFEGEYNLVLIPFKQMQQQDVNTWIPAAQELERSTPGLVYYELPTIYKLPMISRTFINEGMRAGIPDQTSRQKTVTFYIDKETFKDALEIKTEEEITILLVNRQGDLLWREVGRFNDDKLQDLLMTLEKYIE